MALKPGQVKCIQTLDSSLAVSAGAGSGKTFTLTRRIVHALESGAVDDIGRVLAITFTTKAAAELKSRVKGALRAEGMIDQALKVDAAWISTIHGMCARILRAHALEVGVDPSFAVLDEAAARPLLDAAVNEVLASANDLVAPDGLDALFAEYPARSRGPRGGGSVDDLVRTLVTAASANPQGMGALVLPQAVDEKEIVRRMMASAEGVLAAAEAQKPGKSRDALVAGTRAALEACAEALARGLRDGEALGLLGHFPVPGRAFGTPAFKELAAEAAEEYCACMAEARFGRAVPLLSDALLLAERVLAAYRRRKREAGGLDNDDLLVETARAFERLPGLAADYADRFQLVMVDEFQDTDQLQVDMIKRMAGPACERLCTVGDAQQSIYRFRGADVSVYHRHVEETRKANPDGLVLLPDNFRSHADVLAFVDRVFEQPQTFGSSFMSLAPARDESRVARPFLGAGPRIDVQMVTCPHRGVPAEQACRVAAQGIARRFAALRDAGHAAGDMVLLLGSTTRAGVYAEELRREGFPCVVVKGSIFNRAPEVRLMVRLAQAIANPLDSLALFEVLSSELFALSADDFLVLTTGRDEESGAYRRRPLLYGLMAVAGGEGGVEPSPPLAAAARIVEKMGRATGRMPLSAIMEGMVRDSGWFSRMEQAGAEGQARAANVLKAVRMAEDVERAGAAGPASVAARLAERVEAAKEAPGALSAEGGDFVRIMTVHASKGLEFPIVAVAELGQGAGRGDKLLTERVSGAVYASLDLGGSVSGIKDSSLLAKCAKATLGCEDLDEQELAQVVEDRPSAASRHAAIRALQAAGEEQEARRLLYVALTRAKEALVLSLSGKRTKDNPSGAKGLAADVQSALCGPEGLFPEGRAAFDFGGTRPCAFERVDLNVEEPERVEGAKEGVEAEGFGGAGEVAAPKQGVTALGGAAEPGLFDVCEVAEYAPRWDVPLRSARDGVFSYSSIAPAADGGAEDADEASRVSFGGVWTRGNDDAWACDEGGADGGDDAWAAICASLSGDAAATDLGTAFHRLAQYAVIRREGGRLARPSDERVTAICRSCGLAAGQRARLEAALGRWFGSSVATRVAGCANVRAEVPFFQLIDAEGAPVYLEGEIDLLAIGAAGSGEALVVDYKTGGRPDEDPAHLHEKHLLQATCYAYVVLCQGYEAVEAVFVRVEQQDPDDPAEPQCVRYRFAAAERVSLEKAILAAYHASRP